MLAPMLDLTTVIEVIYDDTESYTSIGHSFTSWFPLQGAVAA